MSKGGNIMTKYILAMDQGTTSSRSIIFNQMGTPVRAQKKRLNKIYAIRCYKLKFHSFSPFFCAL